MRLLLFVILSFWADQILEQYCDNLWVFHISEVKNMILYIFLIIMIE